jgi:hypothetical protein
MEDPKRMPLSLVEESDKISLNNAQLAGKDLPTPSLIMPR